MSDVVLKAWLNGARNYNIGATLYRLYGKDEELKKHFALGETPARKAKLLDTIKQLCGITTAPTNTPPTRQHISTQTIPGKNDTAAVVELKGQARPLLKQRDALHAKLLMYATDEERGAAALKILDLDDEIDAIYDKVRYIEQHGKLPPPVMAFDPITDEKKWEPRYQTLGRYVTRYTDKLKKDPKNIKYKTLRDKYEQEQIYYAKKLGKWAPIN
jgi:hypothetical protein